MKPDAAKTSPITFEIKYSRCFTFSAQRIFSSPKPFTSLKKIILRRILFIFTFEMNKPFLRVQLSPHTLLL